MLLLTGPPASGKTAFCVEQFRECLRRRDRDCLLLVPTTTAAEHLRNELAREGFLLSPKAVTTFGRFISDLAPGLAPAGTALIELIVADVLPKLPLKRYGSVSDYAGFRSALVRAVEEFTGAGGHTDHLPLADEDFAAVCSAVLAELKSRGLHLRAARLRHAAGRIRENGCPATVYVTGFFGFTAPEIEVLRALAEKSRLTVAVPEHSSVGQLRSFAKEERQFVRTATGQTRILFTAPTPDGEANEIARRILAEAANGRAFREIGVIARSEKPAVPALRAAFERFGIPARFYFAPPLKSDPTISYLLAVVDAALSGWNFETTLKALRMAGSPLEVYGDGWEHRVLKTIPAAGLETIRELAPERMRREFDRLTPLSAWRTQNILPSTWAKQFSSLTAIASPPAIRDEASPEAVERWRQQSAAVQHFQAAAAEAAAALNSAVPVSCNDFLDALRTVLRSATLRIVDHRRDVVHVIDAVEARQWRLPVVFACGLLETQFPKHHSEDPILPDETRRKLQQAGVSIKTSAERQADEQALFDVVLTRATDRLYLSYAELNAKGEPNLRSFYLERAKPWTDDRSVAVRPVPAYTRASEPHPTIYTEELRTRLAFKYAVLSPSKVETFLQCPFQHFARNTLELEGAPCDPWERFDPMTQGSIAHRVLERHYGQGVPAEQAFEEIFAEYANQKRLPDGYRTEAIRLELWHGIELVAADPRLRLTAPRAFFERDFTLDLGEGTTVRGRIDRLDVDELNNAIVFDYKYRRKDRIRDSVKENEDGTKVQGGLYLLGARGLGYTPAGMVYCGFKKEVSVNGWVVAPLYPHLGSACNANHVAEVMKTAHEVTIRAAMDIRDGRIKPEPEDATRCDWCDFATMCRVETAELVRIGVVDAAQ